MARDDVDTGVDLFVRQDWGDRRRNLEFVIGHEQSRPFIADADGTVVGTGVVTLNGPVAWIGTVFVDPAWRRRGVGRALTRATMDAPDAAGCRTIVLVATDAGRPMYERLGFEVQTWYQPLEAPGLPDSTSVDRGIRPFTPADLPPMVALDAEATGEDRA